jgi:membrane associated rhomboid family serine protease
MSLKRLKTLVDALSYGTWRLLWREVAWLMRRELPVIVAVASLLVAVQALPPNVKECLKMTADSHPFTWLTSNYLHQSLDHLVGNVVAYFWCMALYSAFALTLLALSFDHNSVVKLSLAAHVAALVVAPLVSAVIWQETVQFYAPQHASSPVSGFSTSVSAYIGINAARASRANLFHDSTEALQKLVERALQLLILFRNNLVTFRCCPARLIRACFIARSSLFRAVLSSS